MWSLPAREANRKLYMKLLILLISNETIPNVLCAWHFKPDAILFFTTKGMEKEHKTQIILNGLKKISDSFAFSEEKNNYWSVTVDKNSVIDINDKLDDWIKKYWNDRFDEIIVNITGGTKLMSLGLYTGIRSKIKAGKEFSDKNTKIIYLPIGENKVLFLEGNSAGSGSAIIEERLNIAEFFESSGIQILSRGDDARKNKELAELIMKHYDTLKEFLTKLYGKINDKDNDRKREMKKQFKKHHSYAIDVSFYLETNKPANDFNECFNRIFEFDYLNHLDAKYENDQITIKGNLEKGACGFLKGGWLEQFCFNELLELKDEKIFDDVNINVSVRNTLGAETENEFDVLFTCNNALYMLECKSLNQEYDNKTDILYKISALQVDLGRLTAKSFLVSTSENIIDEKGEIKEYLEKRAKLLKCVIIKPDNIINLKDEIKKKLSV